MRISYLLFLIGFILSCGVQEENNCLLEKAVKDLYENRFHDFQSALIQGQRVMIDSLYFTKPLFQSGNYEVLSVECNTKVIVRYENNAASYVDSIFANVIGNQLLITPKSIVKLFNKEPEISFTLAKQLMTARRFREAIDWLQGISLEKGEKEFLIGKCHFEMNDYKQAIFQFRKAFDFGSTDAGILLSESLQLTGKRNEAIEILRDLADEDNTEAMLFLGEIYDTFSSQFGYLPPEDASPNSSFKWYLKAAELNDPVAMLQIGNIYEFGMNKALNLDSAVYWYNEAAKSKFASAYTKLARLYLAGKYFDRNLEKAMIKMKEAIEADPKTGYFDLGILYKNGRFLPFDREKALFYLKKADSLKHPIANFHIEQILNKDPKT